MPHAILSGWGRFPVTDCRFERPGDAEGLGELVAESQSAIPRGNGRSYGDSSLNPELTIGSGRLDRILAFDAENGLLTCEAGLLLADLITVFVPRGWFAPVTPGTRFVTIGGMIASDVHGKNHHGAGSFCDHVEWLDLAIGDGREIRCSRTENADLFAATCGGMGLTGFVVRTAFKLLSIETAQISQRTVRANNLDDCMTLLEQSLDRRYSVAWIDCLASGPSLGRSLVFLADHTRLDELPAGSSDPLKRSTPRPKSVPIDFPKGTLSRAAVKLFNEIYFRSHRPGDAIVSLDSYFYPLDAINGWNRIYGHPGFVQYQCVLPLETSAVGMQRLLSLIAGEGDPSFLAVLKRMGPQSFGLLSFPRPGYTLALDFPASPKSLSLLDRLDLITSEYGGRLYLAKDARMSPAMMAQSYPRLAEFREIRRRYGLTDRFGSLQSQRLEL